MRFVQVAEGALDAGLTVSAAEVGCSAIDYFWVEKMTRYEWPPGQQQPDVWWKAIAFLDCCGYSAYTQLHGDLAAAEVHLRMRWTVERESAAANVDVVKWMGDGAMLAADDSDAILSCVYRTMVIARDAGLLPLRSGMACGPAATIAQEKPDYFGASVNRAARLCSAAAPWQLRVDTGRGREMAYFTLLSATARRAQRSVRSPSGSSRTEVLTR